MPLTSFEAFNKKYTASFSFETWRSSRPSWRLTTAYSTGQLIIDFFGKKSAKLKYLKNWIAHRKKFSVVVRETNKEENAKIEAFHFENCGGDKVWKIPKNQRFLWIKSFLYIFRKKNRCEKNLFVFECCTTCHSLGNFASQTKKLKKYLATEWVPLTILLCWR